MSAPKPHPEPARQGGLDLPLPPLTWDTLVRGAENETAIALANRPANWATPALCVCGPRRSGLTTLANLIAVREGGPSIGPKDLTGLTIRDVAAIAQSFVSVDDADLVSAREPEMLLSLLNSAASKGGHVLLTAHTPPSRWTSQSADLKSRLNAMPVAEIFPPGETLARDWIAAAGARRFMRLSLETLNYLVPRLELHYEAIENHVQQLSEAVTATGRAPGIALARKVLEGIEDDGDGVWPDS